MTNSFASFFSDVQTVNEAKDMREKLVETGEIFNLKQKLISAPKERKKELGKELNQLRRQLFQAFETKIKQLQLEAEKDIFLDFDPTFYSYKYSQKKGSLHPLTQATQRIVDIFASMGFEVADGPLVETQELCMTKLNIPAYHPARSMQDTFYLEAKDNLDENFVLRTHTSAVQLRYGLNNSAPIKIIVPGQVYRNEKIDATHDLMFHQFECLVIDKKVSVSHLTTLIKQFYNAFFPNQNLKYRFRANYFPYTVPSIEFDISNPNPNAKEKWLEVGGSGLVHPQVIQNIGLNPKKWQGLAFGFGIDRMAQLLFGFNSIGQLFEGDARFLADN